MSQVARLETIRFRAELMDKPARFGSGCHGWPAKTSRRRAFKVLGALYLVLDDTLLHKRGKSVYGLGWFRDAVASTPTGHE